MVMLTSRTEPYNLKDASALLQSFESRLEPASTSTVNSDGSVPTANLVNQTQQKKVNPQKFKSESPQRHPTLEAQGVDDQAVADEGIGTAIVALNANSVAGLDTLFNTVTTSLTATFMAIIVSKSTFTPKP